MGPSKRRGRELDGTKQREGEGVRWDKAKGGGTTLSKIKGLKHYKLHYHNRHYCVRV
jgi:hypothetical protein